MLTVEEMAKVLEINPQRVKIWNRHGLIRGHPTTARMIACTSTPATVRRGKPWASNYRNGGSPPRSLSNVRKRCSVKRKPLLAGNEQVFASGAYTALQVIEAGLQTGDRQR